MGKIWLSFGEEEREKKLHSVEKEGKASRKKGKGMEKEGKEEKRKKEEGKAWFVVFFFVKFPLLVFLNFEEMQCDFSSSFVIMLVDVCSSHHFVNRVFFSFLPSV